MIKLAALRNEEGRTQKEVAQFVGITERGYRKIEKGEVRPSYKVLVKLEELFNLPHSELLAEVTKTQQKSNTKCPE